MSNKHLAQPLVLPTIAGEKIHHTLKCAKKGNFKRSTGLKGGGTNVTFVQAFVRNWIDYIVSQGLDIVTVEKRLVASGKIHMFKRKITYIAAGKVNPYTYVYSLQVLCEAVGRNMWDFVSVHQPEEKEAVRAVIKNPDLM